MKLNFYRLVSKLKSLCKPNATNHSPHFTEIGKLNDYVCASNSGKAKELVLANHHDLLARGLKLSHVQVEKKLTFAQWQQIERSCTVIIESAENYREYARKQIKLMEKHELKMAKIRETEMAAQEAEFSMG